MSHSNGSQYWRVRCVSAEASLARLQDQIKILNNRHRQIQDLESKVSQILKHNTELLHQNAQLSARFNQKIHEVQILESRLRQLQFGNFQDRRLFQTRRNDMQMIQLQADRQSHKEEVYRLIEQINRLQSQCTEIQKIKNIQINSLKSKLQIDNKDRVNSIKREKNTSTEVYENQMRKLKELIDLKNHQAEQVNHAHKLELQRLNEEIVFLTNTMNHRQNMRNLEVQELKVKLQSQIDISKKQVAIKLEREKNQLDKQVFRLKKQLASRGLQIEQLHGKISSSEQQGNNQIKKLKIQKDKLRHEMQKTMARGIQKLEKQIDLERRAAQEQINRLEKANQIKQTSFQNEKKISNNLITELKQQLERAKNVLKSNKESNQFQIGNLKNLLKDCRAQLLRLRQEHQNQLKFINAKHAQIKQAGLSLLAQQLKNQVQALQLVIKKKDESIDDLSAKLIQQIKTRVQVRQNYEIQFSKIRLEKGKLQQEMKRTKAEVRNEAAKIQSKIEIGSMAIISQSQVNKKSIFFLEQERNKMQGIIIAKDREIQQLQKKSDTIKKNFQKEIQLLSKRVREKDQNLKLIQAAQEKEQNIANIREIQAQELHQNQINDLNNTINQLKQGLQSYKSQIQQGQSKIFQLQRQIQLSNRLKSSVQEELAQKNGMIESMQIEVHASATQQHQKQRVKYSKAESGLRGYFDEKIRKLNRDHDDLTDKFNFINQENLRLKGLNRALQIKVQDLTEKSRAFKESQQKIVTLGVDRSALLGIENILKTHIHQPL